MLINMKFIVYFSSSLLLFSLSYSEPLLKLNQLGLIPVTDSMCGASDAPLVTCVFIAVFYAYISLICRALYTVGNVAELGACLLETVPAPFNTVFTSVLGGVANGSLTTAQVCPIFDMYNVEAHPLCPVILLPILDILEDFSHGEPSELTCGDDGISALACTIIEGYSITVRLLCALDETLVKVIDWSDFLICAVDLLPIGLRNLATAVTNGILDGLKITAGPCNQVINYFDDSLNSMCPGLYNSTNVLLDQILSVVKL